MSPPAPVSTAAPAPPGAQGAPAAPTAPGAPAGPGATAAPGAIAVTGQALAVSPGQALAARVLAAQGGLVELALAGGRVSAESDLPLAPGQTLRLVVGEATDERVTLRLVPQAGAAPGAGPAPGAAAALTAAGLSPATASALLAALADAGAEVPSGAGPGAGPGAAGGAGQLAARAAAAGVSTPAQAAAFARLAAAGLPTTPAAVAGLAGLLDGPPLGRALAGLVEAATRAGAAAAGTAPGPAGQVAANWPTAARPIGQPPATPAQTPLADGDLAPAGGQSANWHSGTRPIGQAPPATPSPPQTQAPLPAAPAPLAALAAALTQSVEGVAGGAAAGSPELLRRALAELGVGLEARLAAGSAPDATPVRSLLLSLASHAAADPSLARAASALADGLAAQGLAGAALPAQAQAQAGDSSSQGGAYLQVPLPGGATAEVRVSPDGGGTDAEGRERPRRLAFLLHLSALGPVMIEATAGPGGVEATVRVTAEEARRFLSGQVAELSEALGRTSGGARVSVERLAGPAPERLLPPPPSSGLDVQA